ncbi:MAG: FtsW/RodA/SpoVE family cell cycle protein [Gemmatimonadaceae bacterium]
MLSRLVLQITAASSTATSTPRRVAFVPEHHTDFIFSIVPERLSIVPLVLMAVLVGALIWILRRRRRISRDGETG